MNLEKGKIAGWNLTFLIISFTLGTSLLFPPGAIVIHDAWLTIIVGLVVGLVFAIINTTLANKFPGKTLVHFNEIIYGPYVGKIISIGFIWYFFHTASIILRELGEFFNTIFPNTPMIIFLVFFILICASAVRNGIEVIVRCSLILLPISIMVVLITIVLLLKDMELVKLLPVFDIPLREFIKSSFTTTTFPFGQHVVFLMILAFLNNSKEAKGSLIVALIISAIILLSVSIRNIAILGDSIAIHSFSSYSAVRMINVWNIITRFEIVVAFNLIAMVFLKLSVFFYGTVLGLAQLLKLRSYLPLIFPIGIIMIVNSITEFDNFSQITIFINDNWSLYSIPFQFIIPLLSLVITKLIFNKAS